MQTIETQCTIRIRLSKSVGRGDFEIASTHVAVNDWIKATDVFDAVIDFDLGLRDPDRLTRMLPEYDNGDHLHPGDVGSIWMGDFIDLSQFD